MSETWIVNASPVILLAQVGRLDLLERLCSTLLLPTDVAGEISAGPADDPARQAIERDWGERVATPAIGPSLLEWGLGPGETAVIACAERVASSTAVLDDRLGRLAAKAHGINVVGTLGVVLRAKRAGLIPAAAPVLQSLQEAGMFLRPSLLQQALRRVDETPRSS